MPITPDGHLHATYFPGGAAFRAWLEREHDHASEIWVGMEKKGSPRTGITYREAVDEALCFGWIDGIGRPVDAERRAVRFTPRKKGSIWSAVNLARYAELLAAGRVTEAGRTTFDSRDPRRQGLYSFEQQTEPVFSPEEEAAFRADTQAWAFWLAQPPGYRRTATFLVVSAMRPETRARRLAILVAHSREGRRHPQLSPAARQPKKR